VRRCVLGLLGATLLVAIARPVSATLPMVSDVETGMRKSDSKGRMPTKAPGNRLWHQGALKVISIFFSGAMTWACINGPATTGISPFLAHASLQANRVVNVFEGLSHFEHLEDLTSTSRRGLNSESQFTVSLPAAPVPSEEHPSLLHDFGREVVGRLEVVSDSNGPIKLHIAYGESEGEALHEPYLGIDELRVLPHSTAYGPESAFRYARVQFLEGPSPLRFKGIRLNNITIR
jgi:hypothetical protein